MHIIYNVYTFQEKASSSIICYVQLLYLLLLQVAPAYCLLVQEIFKFLQPSKLVSFPRQENPPIADVKPA